MSLEARVDGLQAHFDRLMRAKAAVHAHDPVFALEHDLSSEQLAELAVDLSRSLRTNRQPSIRHWLGWVVHAAEQGYRFNGQEFWDSFAAATPGWDQFGQRETLRDWFKRFHRQFNGVHPSGRWSETYSYICWPVSHAILPSDLQVQLAESMYNARYSLDLASVLEPSALGALIARHTYGATSRYDGFLQHAALAGRIVRALLQDDDAEGPIYRPTRQRIASDIAQIEHAREWINEARSQYDRAAAIRMRFGRGRPNDAAGSSSEAVTAQAARPPTSLQPRLTVRALSPDRWRIDLAPPSLQGLCSARPELRAYVERASYRLTGHGEGQLPAAGLLIGQPHPRALRRWPAPGESLLQFYPSKPDLDALTSMGCRMPVGTLVVFRLHEPMHGQLLSEALVRPGGRYVVASSDPARLSGLGASVDVDCEGVGAVLLEVPSTVSPALHTKLQQVGITVRRTVSVTPVGLAPRRWTQAGEGEWLTTEHPAFAIENDHELSHYMICLNDGPVQLVRCTPGEPVQLLLSPLDPGEHVLSVQGFAGTPTASSTARATADCEIRLSVRPPAAWSPGVLCDEAFVVDVTPTEPSLDDLLSARLDVHVEGDRTRKIDASLVLEDAAGNCLLHQRLFQHTLPVTGLMWAEKLGAFLRQHADDDPLLAASRGYLLFESDALGSLRVPLHIDARPVRWATQRRGPHQRLRLIDERSSEDYQVRCHRFSAPLQEQRLEVEALLTGIDVAGNGGLYVLEGRDGIQSVVVDQPTARATLDTLRAAVDPTTLAQVTDPATLFAAHQQWQRARACSASARMKQCQVARAIHMQLLRAVCGDRWMRLEHGVRERGASANWGPIDHAVSNEEVNYAIHLTRCATVERMEGTNLQDRFKVLSEGYRMVAPTLSAADAWSVATDLNRLETTGLPWNDVVASPRATAMIRGARLMQLCEEVDRRTP